jgi:nucleotide-binding universal stress UspA family protein
LLGRTVVAQSLRDHTAAIAGAQGDRAGTSAAEVVGMRIIAAIDSSPASLNAARSAAELAGVLGDQLLLVQAVPLIAAQYPQAMLAGAIDLDEPIRQATRESLQKLRQGLAGDFPGLSIEARVEIGFPHEVLTSLARAEGARLIVMGTHGRGAATRLLVGSVCQRTLREAPCPVLALPIQAAPFRDWARHRRPLRVLVGVDRGPGTEAALAFLTSLRAVAACDVTMVHEYWPPAEYARLGLRGPRELGRDDPEVVAILDRDLRAALPALGGTGTADLRIRAGWGPIGAQLALEADAERADLLLLGTHQPHGLDRLITGSEAINALHACIVPLLVVPVPRAHGATTARVHPSIPVLRSVLVATDFSDLGNAAIPHAYSLVRRPDSRVELLHVQERHLAAPAYLLGDRPSMTPEQHREAGTKLTALIPAEATAMGIISHATVVDGGTAPEQILAAAARLGVDAIVLATHGRGGVSRALMGSVAEAVVRGSDRPVYVVKPSKRDA